MLNNQPGIEMSAIPKNLHQIVKIAAGHSMPTAVQRNSFIVNEVSPEFHIITDENVLAAILKNLLTTVVTHSKHSCIRISAKEYEDMIFVSVRDNNNLSYDAVSSNLEHVQQLAKKVNGSVSIRNIDDKSTTILLSFPNFQKAA